MNYDLMIILLFYYVLTGYYLEKGYRELSSENRISYMKLTGRMLVSAIVIFLVFSTKAVFWGLFILSALNLMNLIIKKVQSGENTTKKYFVLEQLSLTVCILILSRIFEGAEYNELIIKHDFFNHIFLFKHIRIAVVVMIIFRPINTVFIKFFSHENPYSQQENNGNSKEVGKLIGNLERLLVLIFLINNQYTAVGLIFTAKTIIRFDEFTDNRPFTEYYMLGTLFSMISVLLVYFALY